MLARVVRWSLERPRLIAWACFWFLAWGAFFMRDVKFELLPEPPPHATRSSGATLGDGSSQSGGLRQITRASFPGRQAAI